MPPTGFDPARPIVVAREIPRGSRPPLKPGTVWDWKKDGVREDRVATLFKIGSVKHKDTTPPVRARRAAGRAAEEKKVKGKPAKKTKAAPPDEPVERPERFAHREYQDNFVEEI